MLLSYQKDNLEKLSTMTDKSTDITIVGKKIVVENILLNSGVNTKKIHL